LEWVRDAFSNWGLLGGLQHYAATGLEFLRDLSPARRRSRYGDIDFDFAHGVDTTWATVPLRTRVREWLSGGQYQPSEPSLFCEILNSLPEPARSFTFIDLGSGKGRALLMGAEYPFQRIIGVELLSELSEIARHNMALCSNPNQRCFNIEVHSGDARLFQFPDEPIALYLFNPFPEHVLRTVLMNLRSSYVDHPRSIYILYHNLVHEGLFHQQAWLQELIRTEQYAVYRLKSE
jgi:SAM-dependent methyltransferase